MIGFFTSLLSVARSIYFSCFHWGQKIFSGFMAVFDLRYVQPIQTWFSCFAHYWPLLHLNRILAFHYPDKNDSYQSAFSNRKNYSRFNKTWYWYVMFDSCKDVHSMDCTWSCIRLKSMDWATWPFSHIYPIYLEFSMGITKIQFEAFIGFQNLMWIDVHVRC